MCGRYRLSRHKQVVEKYFNTGLSDIEWEPRYNIAPTQSVPVIRQDSKQSVRELSLMRWGLIPSWSKDASGAAKMINARCETAAEKPAFRDALKSRRCILPADGFYEWKRTGKTKQPFFFNVQDGELFAFAGIWDSWRGPDNQWVKSCSIMTTQANAVTSPVHERMPVILEPDDYDLWLDPGFANTPDILQMLKPYRADAMRVYSVGTRVNSVVNDDADCSRFEEIAASPQTELFS